MGTSSSKHRELVPNLGYNDHDPVVTGHMVNVMTDKCLCILDIDISECLKHRITFKRLISEMRECEKKINGLPY